MGYRKIRSLKLYPYPTRGAASDELVHGYDLAMDVWGEKAETKNSGLLALAYLHRRFGRPELVGDEVKDLCAYVLTTQDPEIYLSLSLSGSCLAHAVGYLARPAVHEIQEKRYQDWENAAWQFWCEHRPEEEHTDDAYWSARFKGWPEGEEKASLIAAVGPFPRPPLAWDWREKGNDIQRRVNTALEGTMKSLLRRVWVRDVSFNILGREGPESTFKLSQMLRETRANRKSQKPIS